MNYDNFINFNWNKTELKDAENSVKLILHILDNTKRKNDKELINKTPELKDIELIKTDLNKIKKDLEGTKELKKGGKGAKPFRFLTTTLNVEPTKENEAIIKEWADEMMKLYSKYFNIEGAKIHLNETRPHIHIICKNFNGKEWGNFVNGKKIQLSGDEGKKILQDIWNEGQEINKRLAKKYNLKFQQQPTTEKGLDRKIKQFRAKAQTIKSTDADMKKLKDLLISKGIISKDGETEKEPDKADWLLYAVQRLASKCNINYTGKDGIKRPLSINYLDKIRYDSKAMDQIYNFINKRFLTQEQLDKINEYENNKNINDKVKLQSALGLEICRMYNTENCKEALQMLNDELAELDKLKAEKQEKAKKSPTLSKGICR